MKKFWGIIGAIALCCAIVAGIVEFLRLAHVLVSSLLVSSFVIYFVGRRHGYKRADFDNNAKLEWLMKARVEQAHAEAAAYIAEQALTKAIESRNEITAHRDDCLNAIELLRTKWRDEREERRRIARELRTYKATSFTNDNAVLDDFRPSRNLPTNDEN